MTAKTYHMSNNEMYFASCARSCSLLVVIDPTIALTTGNHRVQTASCTNPAQAQTDSPLKQSLVETDVPELVDGAPSASQLRLTPCGARVASPRGSNGSLLSSRSSQGYGRLRVAVDTVVPQFVSDRRRHCVHLFFGPFQAVSEKSETYSFDTPVKHWSSQKTKSVTAYDAPVGECLMAIDSTVEEHRNVYLARAVALPGILSTLPISQPQTRGL
ncbi:hypothetical protein IWW34DRAFT_833678 [Fusarium oxysporum f. sp. albedinis]|nr:hypothetical protein IWW34DRAFT_833678 [Fusarium oxysporum f. sp. albedinis]